MGVKDDAVCSHGMSAAAMILTGAMTLSYDSYRRIVQVQCAGRDPLRIRMLPRPIARCHPIIITIEVVDAIVCMRPGGSPHDLLGNSGEIHVEFRDAGPMIFPWRPAPPRGVAVRFRIAIVRRFAIA